MTCYVMLCYAMVWYGMLCYVMVWCGMALYGPRPDASGAPRASTALPELPGDVLGGACHPAILRFNIIIVRAPPLPPTPDVRKEITLFTGFRTPGLKRGPPKVDGRLTQGQRNGNARLTERQRNVNGRLSVQIGPPRG